MSNSTSNDLSSLALADKEPPPTFPLSTHTSTNNFSVFRISLDPTSDDSNSITDPIEIPHSRKLSEPAFPPNPDYSCKVPSRPRGIHSADPWPVRFASKEWKSVWDSEPLRIEQFLRQANHADRSHLTKEDQFKGVPWRITIAPQEELTIAIPMFTHGQVVTYRNCNRMERRYIINHCAYKDKASNTAYLRVLCYDLYQNVFDAHSLYPPFILAVPIQFCSVQMHPDLDIALTKPITSTSNNRQDDPPLAIPSFMSMDEAQEERPGRIVGFLHAVLELICFR
jgi:hypothetical protein